MTEKRIKAVVSITGVNVGRLFREGFSNYDPLGALEAMATQRTAEVRGELQVNELLPASLDVAKQNGLGRVRLCRDAPHEPIMVVIGQKVGAFGAFPDGMEVYGCATASKDRQLVSLESWSRYDLYHKPEPVGMALEKLAPFFRRHLGGAGAAQESNRQGVIAAE